MNVILLEKSQINNNTTVIKQPNLYQHIIGVLKAKVGDEIKVGVIGGNLGTGVIQAINEADIKLVDIKLDSVPPKKLNLTIILALPRPKVLRRLIIDMTAMGVARIILLNSYKTQKSYWQSPLLKRIDEFVLEGLQQGVDTIPPIIEFKKRFKPFVEDELSALMTTTSPTTTPVIHAQQFQQLGHTFAVNSPIYAIVAHPYANTSCNVFIKNCLQNSIALPQVLCIGAEGGWIDYEVDLLTKHGCLPVSLGHRILRTEAAVNTMCAFWLVE